MDDGCLMQGTNIKETLEGYLRSNDRDIDWFDGEDEMQNRLPNIEFVRGDFRRGLYKNRGVILQDATLDRITHCLGIQRNPERLFACCESKFPFNRDRLYFGCDNDSVFAQFHCRRVKKKVRELLIRSIPVGTKFWGTIDGLLRYFSFSPIGSHPFQAIFGFDQSLFDSRPPTLMLGHLAAICTWGNIGAALLPIAYDDSLRVTDALRQLEWRPVGFDKPGNLHQQLYTTRFGTDIDSSVHRIIHTCYRRDALIEHSVGWLSSLDDFQREDLRSRIIEWERLFHHQLPDVGRLDGYSTAGLTHAKMHSLLFPEHLRDDVVTDLRPVMLSATRAYNASIESRESGKKQHRRVIDLLCPGHFEKDKLTAWYHREQAFCLANCLQSMSLEHAS